jgi:hypothetical protein
MIKEAVDRTAHDESVALESDIKAQRILWMSVVALNMAFGFAGVRAQRYMIAMDEVREDMEEMAAKNGWEYAVEKLREQCEKITGMEVKQVHEEEMLQARKENEARGIFFNAENPEDLARIGFDGARGNGPKWIPVSERLPNDNEKVVCCGPEGGVFIAETRYLAGRVLWNDLARVGRRKATHWMPLPEPPKEDTE